RRQTYSALRSSRVTSRTLREQESLPSTRLTLSARSTPIFIGNGAEHLELLFPPLPLVGVPVARVRLARLVDRADAGQARAHRQDDRAVQQGQIRQVAREQADEVHDLPVPLRTIQRAVHVIEQGVFLRIGPAGDVEARPAIVGPGDVAGM